MLGPSGSAVAAVMRPAHSNRNNNVRSRLCQAKNPIHMCVRYYPYLYLLTSHDCLPLWTEQWTDWHAASMVMWTVRWSIIESAVLGVARQGVAFVCNNDFWFRSYQMHQTRRGMWFPIHSKAYRSYAIAKAVAEHPWRGSRLADSLLRTKLLLLNHVGGHRL